MSEPRVSAADSRHLCPVCAGGVDRCGYDAIWRNQPRARADLTRCELWDGARRARADVLLRKRVRRVVPAVALRAMSVTISQNRFAGHECLRIERDGLAAQVMV